MLGSHVVEHPMETQTPTGEGALPPTKASRRGPKRRSYNCKGGCYHKPPTKPQGPEGCTAPCKVPYHAAFRALTTDVPEEVATPAIVDALHQMEAEKRAREEALKQIRSAMTTEEAELLMKAVTAKVAAGPKGKAPKWSESTMDVLEGLFPVTRKKE